MEQAAMNIRREMARVWIVASTAWAATIPAMVPKQAQQTTELQVALDRAPTK